MFSNNSAVWDGESTPDLVLLFSEGCMKFLFEF